MKTVCHPSNATPLPATGSASCPAAGFSTLPRIGLLVLLLMSALWLGCGGGVSTGLPFSAPASLVSIHITPSNSLLPLASSRQLVATGVYSDGTSFDVTSQAAWSVSSSPGTQNFVTVNSTGLVNGVALGASIVSASIGPVTGVIDLTVYSNGFSSNTIGILAVTLQNNLVDVAYQPQNQTRNAQGLYTVQEINLDEDLFSSTIPAPTALVYSVLMPAGFVPNAAVADEANLEVAVISYSSPEVLVIDASNDPTDLSNNTIIGTFKAPLSKTATFNGVSCMICAAVINPVDGNLLLSTGQGYYEMDLLSGVFTALPFVPAPLSSPAFTLNPVATSPYILSNTFGQNQQAAGEVQILNLTTNAVTDIPSLGLISPTATPVSLISELGLVTDSGASSQALLNLTNPEAPTSSLVSGIGTCTPSGPPLSMAALGVAASSVLAQITPTLFLSIPSGNCVGFEVWPSIQSGSPFIASQIGYGYGTLPATPDGKSFSTGSDPNAIGTFTSVVNKKNYGFLINSTENWIAKVNLGTVLSLTGLSIATPLPAGIGISSGVLFTGIGGAPVVYLSTVPQTGVVSVSNGSDVVNWVSGAQFAIGGQWNGGTITIGGTLPGCVGGTSYIVSSVFSPIQLTLSSNVSGSSGNVNYCFPGTPIPIP